MNPSARNNIVEKTLAQLYPAAQIPALITRIHQLCQHWKKKTREPALLDQTRVWMIAYGDSITAPDKHALATLCRFSQNRLENVISDIHLLPMYPWTSDDGFSVTDYRKIAPELGTWDDIADLACHFNLMFDFVINHVSQQSRWFQGYLQGDPRYENYVISADPDADYHRVTRPRTLPLLTPFTRQSGEKVHIWTTFSADQIDLNFREPEVLLESIDILLQYAACGARAIRLDAIGFLWKEKNSCCIHLAQTHQIIKLWRVILEETFPDCLLITETNVPHQENIQYFGNGDEAHMVYQFPLPPLTLHAFLRGDARWLRQWAQSLDQEVLPENTTFFNFLASHDGIGLRPVEHLLDGDEKAFLINEVERKHGRVSWKTNPDGSQSPYELNINYLSALSEPGENIDAQVDRFVASQAILFMLRGVPAIYYHSLFGSENDQVGLAETGVNRRINRQKLDFATLNTELLNPKSLRARIFSRLATLLTLRRKYAAFSPQATQRVLDLPDTFFGLVRHHPQTHETLYCVVNLTGFSQPLSLPATGLDLLTGECFSGTGELNAWQILWLNTDTPQEA
ncbi:sugar phosphorylase [Klebsiella aerogenes]|nr:sugar phosphorylase [Klebsiella aerogenes]